MEKKKSELMRIRTLERQAGKLARELEKELNKIRERLKRIEEVDQHRCEMERMRDPYEM